MALLVYLAPESIVSYRTVSYKNRMRVQDSSTRTAPRLIKILCMNLQILNNWVIEMTNQLLEGFGNPQRSVWQIPAKQTSKEKETQICHWFVQTICLLSWLSACVLTIRYFCLFLPCRSAIPKRSAKPIASIHHTVEYPIEKTPSLMWLCKWTWSHLIT